MGEGDEYNVIQNYCHFACQPRRMEWKWSMNGKLGEGQINGRGGLIKKRPK